MPKKDSAPKKAAKNAKKAAKKVTKKAAKKAAAKKATKKVSARKSAPKKTATTRKPSKSTPSPAPLTMEAIAAKAYRIYLTRLEEGQPGDEFTDWLAAEEALRAA